MSEIIHVLQQYHVHVAFIITVVIILAIVKNNDITAFLRFLFHGSNSLHRALRIYNKLPDSPSRDMWKNHVEALAVEKLFGKYFTCKNDRVLFAQFHQEVPNVRPYVIKPIAHKIYTKEARKLAIKDFTKSDKRVLVFNQFCAVVFYVVALDCLARIIVHATTQTVTMPSKLFFNHGTAFLAVLGIIFFIMGTYASKYSSIKKHYDEVKKLIEQFNRHQKKP